ncbi:hypothetical protein CGSHiII_02275 [Haemophilus influenzae PittII]|nr:hypothetical protein CGSHiII_02275 [Haemophilus influenzae PittII]
MTLSDLIAFSALIVSIFALPISYILGARGLKNTAYNGELSKLSDLCDLVLQKR